jgi:hypothetical protein
MSERHVFIGTFQVLGEITRFCRAVYYRTYGPEEGERRFRNLKFTDAVALWRAGLPHSRHTPSVAVTVH